MTLFSQQLRQIRKKRGLMQREMAELIGIEQSYLSALECGHKPPPQKGKLDFLILKLKLDSEEDVLLREAAERSRRTIKIPRDADNETLELCYLLEKKLSSINLIQKELIGIALRLTCMKDEAPKM